MSKCLIFENNKLTIITIFALNYILKRSRDFLLYTKKETSSSLHEWLNSSCYSYLPPIFYERKYTITWLLWNATSCDVNIVVKLTYFRFDRLRILHIINMATMKTSPICNIRGSYDDWRVLGTRFDGLVFRTFLSENCYTLLLTLVQSFERFLVMQKALVQFKHRKIVFVQIESSVTRNIGKRSLIQTLRRY